VVQGVLARIVGDDNARVDDHALNAGPPPVLPPPAGVVADRVDLSEIGLTPAVNLPVPGCWIDAHDFSSVAHQQVGTLYA